MQTEQQSLRAAAGQRFWQIDALRGLALLNMLVYHAMYDWVYIFWPCQRLVRYLVHALPCVAAVYLLELYSAFGLQLYPIPPPAQERPAHGGLRGGADRGNRCCHAGGSHLVRRAAPAGLCGPADLSAAPRAGKAAPAGRGVTGSAVLFALLNQLPQGWLGFEGTHLAALPAAWYKPNLFWLGLPDLTVFSSSDYFPLFAVGVFVLGGVLFCAVVPRPLHRAARPAAQSPAPPVRRGQPHAADLYAAPAGDLRRFIGLAVLGFCINYCPDPAYEGQKTELL